MVFIRHQLVRCLASAILLAAISVPLRAAAHTVNWESMQEGKDYARGELLVRFREGVSEAKRLEHFARVGVVSFRPMLMPNCYVLKLNSQMSPRAAWELLSKNRDIDLVAPNRILRKTCYICPTPDDPEYQGSQYNLGQIKVDSAWNDACPELATIAKGQTTGIVAVIDTGMRTDHQDIAGRLWSNAIELAGAPGVDDDGNTFVDDISGWDFGGENNNISDTIGHGTHVGGIIGALTNNGLNMAGILWNGALMVLKAGEDDAGFLETDTADAITYAAAKGAKVVNMSYGAYGTTPFQQAAIDLAYSNSNVLFVASAGNANTNAAHYPSGYPNVISVAAVNSSDTKSSYSNYGKIDVAAPGGSGLGLTTLSNLNSTITTGASGTSIAAPHVAGLAGILMSWGLVNTDARARIEKTADDANSGTFPGYDIYLGWGRINVQRAVGTLVPPTGFAAVASGCAVDLNWSAPCYSTFGVNYYFVERATAAAGPFGIVHTGNSSTVTAWSDSGVMPGILYHYQVRAVDAQGLTTLASAGQAVVACTPTPTPTGTYTSTATITQTSTDSPTATDTATPTFSVTETATGTATSTFTPTPTDTPTSTITDTMTHTPTATETATHTSTATDSPTATISSTHSPSYTVTDTPTISPTFSESPTVTVTLTPEPASDGKLLEAVMVPNPVGGSGARLVVRLSGVVLALQLDLYSPGYTLVDRIRKELSMGPGYQAVVVDSSRWPQGLLYMKVFAESQSGRTAKFVKVFVVR